jgi:bifunctional non-homologous end joining protein LigD
MSQTTPTRASTRALPRGKAKRTDRSAPPAKAPGALAGPRAKARASSAARPPTRKSSRKRASTDSLKEYRAKRNFALTQEPQGDRLETGKPARAQHTAAQGARKRAPVDVGRDAAMQFVVQKHAARNLHYDFRLELGGVLLSWSVPKGPSLKAGARRLAVRTEDHPLEYADFEGIIPAGEYGGGTVIVWDRGTWSPEGDLQADLKKGRLNFRLQGDKLSGRFHLVRTRLDKNKRENWLLFKGHDEHEAASDAAEVVESQPKSALSGRTIEEVASVPARVWHSNRSASSNARAKRQSVASSTQAKSHERGGDVKAMLARLDLGVKFTNLDKLLYPEQNLRKAELIAYYASVAPLMLPHIGGRPLTLVRCPSGSQAKCFYQKHAGQGVPDAVRRIQIAESGDKLETYLAVDDRAGLVALAQLGVLEVHTWGCHADEVEQPDQFVFDLDPAEGLAWKSVVAAAEELRERLDALKLESFVKTTGGKGLHVVVPVRRGLDWETHKAFARALTALMAKDSPTKYLINMRKDLRAGKVFLDYLRNARGATAVAPYSTRARAGAPIATPLSWDELEDETQGPPSRTLFDILQRLSRPDPWREYFKVKQGITAKALASVGLRA